MAEEFALNRVPDICDSIADLSLVNHYRTL